MRDIAPVPQDLTCWSELLRKFRTSSLKRNGNELAFATDASVVLVVELAVGVEGALVLGSVVGAVVVEVLLPLHWAMMARLMIYIQ